MHGLDDFNASKALFSLVKLEFAMKRKKLNPSETLTLCLMRLRLDKAVVDLANRFKSIVSKGFLRVLDMLFGKLWPIIIWPEGSELIASMPMCFRAKFVTKIITVTDCFELYYILKDQSI